MRTVNITDFKMINPLVAKVVIGYTGHVDREFIRNSLTAKLQNSATPVVSSFKEVKPGVAVGFVKATKDIRQISDKQITAGYRSIGGNVLMDKSDNSLWGVKSGAAGKYLVRQEQEDLSALVQAAAQRRVDIPRLNQIAIAAAAAKELVAFVDMDGDMDYGFAMKGTTEKVKVMSFARRCEVTVDYDSVVSIYPIQIPKQLSAQVLASMTPAEKSNAKAYWDKLFFYAPDYLRQIKEYVDQGTFV
jgi:hypothetical protein